jgi:O-antigen/teichoic acid export membrane protein
VISSANREAYDVSLRRPPSVFAAVLSSFRLPRLRNRLHDRLAGGVFWSVAGSVASRGMSLIAAICTARLLGAERLGQLGMVQATSAAVGVLAGLGLGLTVTNYVAGYRDAARDRAGRVIGLALLWSASAGTVMGAIVWALAPHLSRDLLHAPALADALAISGALLVLSTVAGTQAGALTGLEAFRAVATLNAIRGICSAGLLVAGAWLRGVAGAVCGLALAEAAGVVVAQFVLARESSRRGIRITWTATRGELGSVLKFSLPALLSSVAVAPVLWLTRLWLVRGDQGYVQAGIYDAAQKWVLVILFLPTAIVPVQLPMLANLHSAGLHEDHRAALRAGVALTSIVCLAVAVPVIVMAPYLMRGFGEQFAHGQVLAIGALGTLPIAMNAALGQALVTTGRIWWRCGYDVLLAALLLAAGWYLIPALGAEGLALASVLGYTLTSVALALHLRSSWPRRSSNSISPNPATT